MPAGMTDNKDMACIPPERLGPDSRFKFSCHKGVSCFTQCCRGIKITLTPYDIIRLKNRLDLSSEEFLALYTEPQLLEKTDLPMVTLKHLDDEQQSCPFVRDDGCIIYSDRPTTCRYYPLGVAALSHKEGADGDDFFFLIKEPHCNGFAENQEWSVDEWRKDQMVAMRDEINAGWTDLLVRKRSFPANIKLAEPSKKMFFLASYNIDKFKDFVFSSSFLDRYDIPEQTIETIRDNEIELLKFAVRWLKWVLFKEGEFKFKENAPTARKK
jgi:Fe-S-cluster containining protein